jgi:hypothetical protein
MKKIILFLALILSEIVNAQVQPKISFEGKTLKGNTLQEGTHGDNSEIELILNIDGVRVDSFNAFGQYHIETNDNQDVNAYFASDLSQVTISSKINDDNNVILTYYLFSGEIEECMETGEPILIWEKTYSKSTGKWEMSNCNGSCN